MISLKVGGYVMENSHHIREDTKTKLNTHTSLMNFHVFIIKNLRNSILSTIFFVSVTCAHTLLAL